MNYTDSHEFVNFVQMADHELTVDEALDPSATTDAAVKQMRENSVSLVCSDTPIGGIDAQIWRVEEGLPKTALGATRALKKFNNLRHWYDPNKRKSTAVMFGFAAHSGRTIAVLEKAYGGILDPIKLYGARDASGALVRSIAKAGKAETVPSWTTATFDELIEMLRKAPHRFSLLEYNGFREFQTTRVPRTIHMILELLAKHTHTFAPLQVPTISTRSFAWLRRAQL